MSQLTYAEPTRMTRSEILAAVEGDTLTCADALLSAALFEDVCFAEPLVISASRHSSSIVRGAALISIGHMARIHKDANSSQRLMETISQGLADVDPTVRGKSDDALDDIVQFVPSLRDQAMHIRTR